MSQGFTNALTLPLPVASGGTGVANSNWTAGSLTFSPTTQGIVGTTTNDNAAAGYVGQAPASYVSSGAPVAITSAVQTNITSLSFSPGDYDIYFQLGFVPASTKVLTLAYAGISTTSATLPSTAAANGFASWFGTFTGDGGSQVVLNGYARYSFATTTTVYLVGFTACTGNTNGFGGIAARRAR
jgi:hypothetical protein